MSSWWKKPRIAREQYRSIKRDIAASTAAVATPSVDIIAASSPSDPVFVSGNDWCPSSPYTSATESDESYQATYRDEQQGEHMMPDTESSCSDTNEASYVQEAPSATEELATLA